MNGLVGVVPQRHASLEKDVGRRLRHWDRFRVAITTRVFMSKVRDVIGRQKDHDRLRHLKAASGACPMYALPDPVAVSSCSIRLVQPNSSEPTGARRSHS